MKHFISIILRKMIFTETVNDTIRSLIFSIFVSFYSRHPFPTSFVSYIFDPRNEIPGNELTVCANKLLIVKLADRLLFDQASGTRVIKSVVQTPFTFVSGVFDSFW